MSSTQRSWFSFGWLRGWSWTERAIVGLLSLLPIVPLVVGWRSWSWLAGLLALSAVVALNVVVYRHGGWQLLGPHFFYDVVRLARRGRSTILRIVYILAMLIGLYIVYENTHMAAGWNHNDFARVSDQFAYTLFLVQNLAIVVLAPAYLGSAIAEEKERRTLELLFTTQLSDTEIILGKLTSRLIHLFGFVLAGVPVLCLIQFWGGIDFVLIAGNIVNTLLNILSIGSICLLLSVLCRTVAVAVMTSYAIILPSTLCCVAALRGFPFVLQDARQAGERVIAVQDLGLLAIAHLVVTVTCLVFAIVALRETEVMGLGPMPQPRPPEPGEPRAAPAFVLHLTSETLDPPDAKRRIEHEDAVDAFANPYTLPPVSDNALMWKERYVGGPPWSFSPIVLVPAIPFVATGVMVIVFWFLRALALDADEYQRAQQAWSIILRFFYYVFLGCYIMGVAYNATGTVVRERQQRTLDALLLLPVERREILWAKWVASLTRGWPWLALLLADILLGTAVGVYHPLSALLLCLVPWPMVVFLASLGLLVSVTMQTVMRANLVLVLVMLPFFYISAGNVLFNGPAAYIPMVMFSTWGQWDQWAMASHHSHPFVIAWGLMILYVLGAAACWKLALVMFENRTRPMEK